VKRTRPPLEIWALLAYAIGSLLAAAMLFLGLRTGGGAPILVWLYGLQFLPLAAFALLIAGAIWSARKPPFLRTGRKLPFLVLLLVIGAGQVSLPYPSSHEGHESATCFRMPFHGENAEEWTVFWGGEKKEESLLAVYTAGRRWGLDLVVAKDGKTHAGSGREAWDYFVFGRDVLAPADGVVVRTVGDVADGPPGVIVRGVDPRGNRIVLETGDREFVFLSHLAQGSIAVRPGQTVKSGDFLGRVGCSGWSPYTPEPHLAIHLQDTAEDGRGEPIPWYFCDYIADAVRVDKGLPRGGIGPGGALQGQRITVPGR
jgi:peptidase M23-like protein